MRIRRILPMLLVPLLVAACATTSRMPLADVPAGNYELVEPASDVHVAVAINENAFAVRQDRQTYTGQHWVDSQGRLHLVDDTGPCAGLESVWTYSYAGNRLTLEKVSDACTTRQFEQGMVFQRS